MALKNTVHAIPLSKIDSATLNPIAFLPINTGLPESCFLIRITNCSDVPVSISYDGSNEQELVDEGMFFELNPQRNHSISNNVALFPKGLVIYCKGNAGTGYIYLTGYYQV